MEEQPEPPGPLLNKPDLYEDLIPVWESFWFLHLSRPVGMEVGAIPLSEIIAYWRDIVGVGSRLELAEKVNLVRIMDETFLKYSKENRDGV